MVKSRALIFKGKEEGWEKSRSAVNTSLNIRLLANGLRRELAGGSGGGATHCFSPHNCQGFAARNSETCLAEARAGHEEPHPPPRCPVPTTLREGPHSREVPLETI
ncbi:unnamed protein product [Caretta caretta]